MNDLTQMTNESLLNKTKSLVNEERKISVEVLRHLREIESRKAYYACGYLSLFEYAVTELKYSDSAAMRRIQAMHAMKENPELETKLEEGTLTVSGVARIQSFIRKEEKVKNVQWEAKEKLDLYQSVENHSQREIEKTLVQISPQSALIESIKPVTEELSEIKIYLSVQEVQELDTLRNLLGHQLKNPGSNSELIQKLIKISKAAVLEKKLGKKEQATPESRNASPTSKVKPKIETRYIPIKLKQQAFAKANLCCEHRDPRTHRRCMSSFKLEIDHIKPYAMGGTHQLSNLRVLCQKHNQARNDPYFYSNKDSPANPY